MRFFRRRVLLTIGAISVLVLLLVLGGAIVYVNSPAFKERARQFVIDEIEARTGGQAELEQLRWDLWEQRFFLENLTVRGLEAPDDPPLAHFESITVGLSFRSLFQRRIDLFELIVRRPEFHVSVNSEGRTNLPVPPPRDANTPFNLELAIDNFQIVAGMAIINERAIEIDLELANLAANLDYQNVSGVLSMDVGYDGMLHRDDRKSIPYRLSADMDYTRGTLLTHQVEIQSGETSLKLQGRINEALTKNLSGRLEYAGNIDVPFLNYFFDRENFSGTAAVSGFLEFSRGYFFTQGEGAAENVTFDGWNARDFKGKYSYHYPGRRLAVHEVTTRVIGGTAAGSVAVEDLPGRSRVLLDLQYSDVDAMALARAYPWDPKYRIFSRITGNVQGWFQGKFTQFDLSGSASLKSYEPQANPGDVPLPLDGFANYEVTPGRVLVSNADIRFFSTALQADGLIHEANSDLKVRLSSSNLSDAYFIYPDANGSGSFDGTVTGPIRNPRIEGTFDIRGHQYRQWTIQQAFGNIRLDTLTRLAELQNVEAVQGQSKATINGMAALDGSSVDLRIQSSEIRSEDIASFVDRRFEGVFSGTAHVTSFSPIRVEGDVRATNLVFEGHSIGSVRAHVDYRAPVIEIQDLALADNGASLTGQATYDLDTEALNFAVRINALNLDRLRDLGVPQALSGVIQQAQFTGKGTRSRPEIQGQALVRNLAFAGETFPEANLVVRSNGPRMNVTLAAARNLDLSADIDTSQTGYPFSARASFTNYSVEELAGFSQGTVTISGQSDVSGLLIQPDTLRGTGRISAAIVRIQDRTLQSTRPFTFDFNSDRLTLTGGSLSGEGTEVAIAGTVALTESAPLDLDVNGRVDLGLLAAADPAWMTAGALTVDGRVGGSVRNPNLRGLAHFTNASFGRRGVFTSLSSLNGDVFFDENRITLNNLEGQVGGGAVQVQGTGLIRNGQIEAMNIRIETDDVRIRYPEGLRTVVDGTLVLRGSWTSPLLEGELEIQSMAYRSAFEEFLRLFQAGALENNPSALGSLALSIHVEGGRNISIQNELADVQARVDLDIKGTVAKPALTGHVEVSGGTLLFQGTRYEITRGNIDFVDPLRIDPIVDIQAETELRDYRVILAISGRGDRLRLDMRSDPPLPQLEIVSLIAGGKTREELALQSGVGGTPTSEQLFQGGAASILFDLVRSRVGGRFELLGLDRVRIDPFLVGAENNPSARITLSEQVTKDLSITYSQDLSSNRQQIILIEYFVSRDVSVVASRDETGALGLDLRRRQRF